MELLNLYQYADGKGISVDDIPLRAVKALSAPLGAGSIAIDLNKIVTNTEKITCLAHELGHCETGSFYNIHSRLDIRQKHENRADKWAIKKLVPYDELEIVVLTCKATEIWDLAEIFNVTEDFMRKAIEYYKREHIK